MEKGQIWTTSPRPKNIQGQQLATVELGVPVLIVDHGNRDKKLANIIRVMPLSFDIGFHKEGDTACFDASGPLGSPFLVEIFNECPMLAGNLGRYRNFMPETDMEKIEVLLKQYRYGEDSTDEQEQENAEEQKQEKEEEQEQKNEEDSDAELKAWQKREITLCEYLTFPVNESILDVDENVDENLNKRYSRPILFSGCGNRRCGLSALSTGYPSSGNPISITCPP